MTKKCLCLEKRWVIHYDFSNNTNKIKAFVLTCRDCAKKHRTINIVQYEEVIL